MEKEFIDMSLPDYMSIGTNINVDPIVTPTTSTSFDVAGSLGNIDLGGVASIASVIGGFMANKDEKKYKKEMLKREDERIDRAVKRQDKFESGMKDAWN